MSRIRNSNIELLRILGMFLIVLGHFAWHTEWTLGSDWVMKSSINSLWIGGKLGVDIFVLISGFFLIKSRFKVVSFLRVWLIAYLYTFLTYIAALATGINNFNVKDLIKALFLVDAGYLNWFVAAYLIMYLLSPYMNVLLKNLNKSQFQLLLTIFLVLSTLRTLFHNPSIGTTGNDGVWLIVVYCFGAYIRLFQDDLKRTSSRLYVFVLVVSLALSVGSIFALNLIQCQFNIVGNPTFYSRFVDGFSPLQLISACCIFILTIKSSPFKSKLINKVASTTFAIYLIHANLLIVGWLWNDVVRGYQYENSFFIFLYAFGVSTVIFLTCSVIDLLRQILFKKMETKIINRIANYIVNLSFFRGVQ